MKKILFLLLVVSVLFITVGCTKKDNEGDNNVRNSVIIEDSIVNENIKGWAVYTNPQFRYEIRHPKSWLYQVDDEGEKIVVFHPKREELGDDYFGLMIFQGITNWKNNYSLLEYYDLEAVNNYYTLGFESKDFLLKGNKAVWFKDVDGLYGDKVVQIIAIDLNDRILEIHLFDMNDDVMTALNSIKFY